MTETWNTSIPVKTNIVADDLLDMNENFTYLMARNGYLVDSTEADQGVAGSGNSVKDLVDAIGVVKKATLFFPHHAIDGNTTVYTFSTTVVIPANINIAIQPGAILTDDANNATLKIYGPMDAPLAQIFDWGNGTGYVRFGLNSGGPITVLPKVTEVFPQWWGADGDNMTSDDTDAMEEAILAGNHSHIRLHLIAGTYRVVPGSLTPITCDVCGPAATIGAYDNTDDSLIQLRYGNTNSKFELKALIGYDIPYYYTYNDALATSGTGLELLKTGFSEISVSRVIGFTTGVHLNASADDAPVSDSEFRFGQISNNDYGIKVTTGTTYHVENDYFNIRYFYDNRVAAISIASPTKYHRICFWRIGALETHVTNGSHGIVMTGEVFRNTFKLESLIPNATGKLVHNTGGHDNRFQMPCVDFSKITTNSGNVFDMHTGYVSDEMNVGATPPGRSMIRGAAAPTAAYWRDGDICWNDSPSDGTIGWVCVTAGLPGTWVAFAGFQKQLSISTSSDDLDVTGVGTLWADTTGGTIVLGGLKGGMLNQKLQIIKTVSGNDLTIENNEGVGTQEIYTNDGANITLGTLGGVHLICNATAWYVVSE